MSSISIGIVLSPPSATHPVSGGWQANAHIQAGFFCFSKAFDAPCLLVQSQPLSSQVRLIVSFAWMTVWRQVVQVHIQLVPEDKWWGILILQFLIWKVEWPRPSSRSVQIIKCSEWSLIGARYELFLRFQTLEMVMDGFQEKRGFFVFFFLNKIFASLPLFFIVEF